MKSTAHVKACINPTDLKPKTKESPGTSFNLFCKSKVEYTLAYKLYTHRWVNNQRKWNN